MPNTVVRTLKVNADRTQYQYEEIWMGGQEFKYRNKNTGQVLSSDMFWDMYHRNGNKLYP
jgi:hypothetical protein